MNQLIFTDADLIKSERGKPVENITAEDLRQDAYAKLINSELVTFERGEQFKVLKDRFSALPKKGNTR